MESLWTRTYSHLALEITSLFRAVTDSRHPVTCLVELETKVHPKVRNHGEGPYWGCKRLVGAFSAITALRFKL